MITVIGTLTIFLTGFLLTKWSVKKAASTPQAIGRDEPHRQA
jgi:hypothetical protein